VQRVGLVVVLARFGTKDSAAITKHDAVRAVLYVQPSQRVGERGAVERQG